MIWLNSIADITRLVNSNNNKNKSWLIVETLVTVSTVVNTINNSNSK